jgi:hypothetical protein
VHALTPRHRRKAGSGPPASALIAWIITDPYLRDAATTASHRREIDLPLLSGTRSAKAAVAACFVLACAAAMGITEIVSHGRAEAQPAMAASLVVKPRSTTAPGSPIGPVGPASRPVTKPPMSAPLDSGAPDGSGNQVARPPTVPGARSAAGPSSNPARGPGLTQGFVPGSRSARR